MIQERLKMFFDARCRLRRTSWHFIDMVWFKSASLIFPNSSWTKTAEKQQENSKPGVTKLLQSVEKYDSSF